jgi:arylsulfatase
LPGHSLVPAFARDVSVSRDFLYFHHENNRALRMGDWKLVSKRPNTNDYALYDLSRDRSEQVNLAEQQPERVRAMANKWVELEKEFRGQAGTDTNAPTAPRRAGAANRQ